MKVAVRHRISGTRSAKRASNPLRILIIGAGVGGISIARGLLRDGHDVTVFDSGRICGPVAAL